MLLQPPPSFGLGGVTDAIAAANTLVLGLAPAQALASMYMNLALSSSLAGYNAVQGQMQQQAVNVAAHVKGLLALYGCRRRRR